MATVATPLQKELMTETYMDVERLLYGISHQFKAKYGGELDEWMSSATVYFIKAYREHESDRPFIPWVKFIVFKCLLEEQRRAIRHMVLSKRETADVPAPDSYPDSYPSFPLTDFLDELGSDAREVVRLTLNTPIELAHAMVEAGGKPHHKRKALHRYLRELGWTTTRIVESFSEVTTALSSF